MPPYMGLLADMFCHLKVERVLLWGLVGGNIVKRCRKSLKIPAALHKKNTLLCSRQLLSELLVKFGIRVVVPLHERSHCHEFTNMDFGSLFDSTCDLVMVCNAIFV